MRSKEPELLSEDSININVTTGEKSSPGSTSTDEEMFASHELKSIKDKINMG